MKAILPSLRERKRYIVFEVISKKEINGDAVAKALYDAAEQFFGSFGAAKMALKMMMDKWDKKAKKGIVRVNRASVNHAKALFCLMEKISKSPVIIRSLGASGTLKKAERKYLV